MPNERDVVSLDSSPENSYSTLGHRVLLQEYEPVFSVYYWLTAWVLIGISIILLVVSILYSDPILGIVSFGMLFSTSFAWLRSAWMDRLVNRFNLREEGDRIRKDPITYYVTSFFLGGLTMIASGIAFASVCIPGGQSLFISRTYPAFQMIFVLGFSTLVGLVYLGFAFFSFRPSLDYSWVIFACQRP